jgi:hypothetical protein
MKKTLLTSILSLAAAGAFAQGTVVFNNHVVGTINTHIYAPDTANPGVEFTGNAANDTPASSAVYTGVVLGGASGAAGTPINYSFGNNFSVQLFASGTLNAPVGSLLPVSQYITTMKTGATGAGYWVQPSLASDPGIPNTPAGGGNVGSATVAVAAWYNGGGTITSLSAAQSANVPWGMSPTFNLTSLGEPANAGPPVVNSTPAENLIGLQSFSLTTVPEPSTIALGVMGISAFLIRRRK